MKKGIAILLLVLYSIPLLSNNCQLHFCGGKLKSMSFYSFGKKSCCGKKKMAKGCCKDIQVFCKAEKHDVATTPKLLLQKDVKEITPTFTVVNYTSISAKIIWAAAYDPPDITGTKLCVLTGNFRI